MSRLFEPVKFPETKEEKPIPPSTEDNSLGDITAELKLVEEEIGRAQDGSSKVIRRAIQFPKGKSPVLAGFGRLSTHPTKENLRLFLQLAQQDMGLAHARFFANIFRDKVPEVDRFHG